MRMCASLYASQLTVVFYLLFVNARCTLRVRTTQATTVTTYINVYWCASAQRLRRRQRYRNANTHNFPADDRATDIIVPWSVRVQCATRLLANIQL